MPCWIITLDKMKRECDECFAGARDAVHELFLTMDLLAQQFRNMNPDHPARSREESFGRFQKIPELQTRIPVHGSEREYEDGASVKACSGKTSTWM